MIDLARIEECVAEKDPYNWAFIDQVFLTADSRRLTRTYPRDGFKTVDGYDGEKGYRYEVRSLIGMGATATSHHGRLSAAWRRLAADLLSPAYRRAMSRLTGLDLSALPIEVNVFHFGPGDWQGPHLDLIDKVATHIFYFNQARQSDEGGFFRVLRSRDPNDVAAEIAPVIGNSVVVVRSDQSWHMVSKVAEGSSASRRSMTVTFYRPASVSTMWPAGDPALLHPYPPPESASGYSQRLKSLFKR